MDKRSDKIIELKTNDNNQKIILKNFIRFSDDSGFCCSIFLKSYPFTAEIESFYIDIEHFQFFLPQIIEMNNNIKGNAELSFRYERDKIKFNIKEFGHLEISGEFYDNSVIDQKLYFGFVTDQTVLNDFIVDLKNIYNDLDFKYSTNDS